MSKVLSIGEATIDAFVFFHDAHVAWGIDHKKQEICFNYADKIAADELKFTVGGNAANTAVAFARLGLNSQLYSMIGDDYLGRQILDALETEKVDTRYVQSYQGPTSYTTALVFQGERTLLIYHVPHDYHLPDFEPVDWVYLTSMGASYQTAYEKVLAFVRHHHTKVCFNPGTFQLKAGLFALKPYLAVADVLILNKEESQGLTELPASATFTHLAEALYDLGPRVVVITDGPRGAYAFDGNQLLFCEIFPRQVVERTGAGDAYGAGFTAALALGKDVDEAMRWGMANSAGVVAQIGPEAGLLTKDQMAEMLNDNHAIRPKVVRR